MYSKEFTEEFFKLSPTVEAQYSLGDGFYACWNIIDDLKQINEKLNNPLITAVATLYEAKFQNTQDAYEDMLNIFFENRTKEATPDEPVKKAAKKATKKAQKK